MVSLKYFGGFTVFGTPPYDPTILAYWSQNTKSTRQEEERERGKGATQL